MNKLVGYTVLVLGTLGFLLVFGLVKSEMKEIVYEKNGLQFEYLSKGKAIIPTADIQFFSSQEGQEITMYMNAGYGNKGLWTNLSVFKTNDANGNIHTLATKALNGQVSDSLIMNLDKNAMIDLIASLKDYRGAKLSRYNAESGWFGYVDDTVIIFVLFGFLFVFICLTINSLTYYLSKKVNSKIEWLIPGILAFFLAYHSTLPGFSIWAPFSEKLNWNINFTTIFLSFLVFRFIIKKSQKLEFYDQEVIKFFTIIIATYAIGFICSQIGFNFESRKYNNIFMIYNHGPHPIVIGMTISLAAGNLLANLVRRMIKMRGSEKLLKKTELALGKSSANLQSLQSTINPHFLYNSLNSIASAAKVDGDKTERMALALSSFYKYITNKSNESITTLSEELEMLENYLKIEKIRFEEVLKVDLDINSNASECRLPRLLLQPLVENAIKYGYNEDGISVKITAEKVDGQLNVKIFDSGTKFGPDMQIGFGIKSVTQKLDLLYPEKHTIEFKSSPSKHILIKIDQNEIR
ncbi:MAG: anti-sigma regulatory factor (Ser/Thr protein kinase) [Halioglobus sp.]|jgi:anti-sigma regulatory factor (Ser/Thr protein kinase)